jgi:CRP-like cAMP-binding protein
MEESPYREDACLMTPETIARFLADVSLFHEMLQGQLVTLASKAKVMFFPRGSVIFRIGDHPNWIYFLYEGYVTEFVSYGSSVSVIVKTRREHDYIGEMAILSGLPYTNTAMAMGDVTAIAFSKETLLDIMKQHYHVSHHIILELIDRLTNSAKKLIKYMYLDAPARLAFTIVSLHSDMGNHHEICVTQSELAEASGMVRQTAAKILGEWRDEGYIKTTRGRLTTLDVAALLNIISECERNC